MLSPLARSGRVWPPEARLRRKCSQRSEAVAKTRCTSPFDIRTPGGRACRTLRRRGRAFAEERCMTPFMFTDEQEMFRDTVRRLAQAEFRDGYLERATSSEYPRAALAVLAKNGLLGLAVPEELGGQAAEFVTMGIAIEELARAD